MQFFRNDRSVAKDSFTTAVEYYADVRKGMREKADHNKRESQFCFYSALCFTLATPLFVTWEKDTGLERLSLLFCPTGRSRDVVVAVSKAATPLGNLQKSATRIGARESCFRLRTGGIRGHGSSAQATRGEGVRHSVSGTRAVGRTCARARYVRRQHSLRSQTSSRGLRCFLSQSPRKPCCRPSTVNSIGTFFPGPTMSRTM
jgi:hypothetical protein